MAIAAAFFDADETLIKGSSSYHLARELYRRNFFGWRDIAFAAWHAFMYVSFGEDMTRIKKITDRACNVMAGHSIAELESISDEVYDTMLDNRVFAGTREMLDAHLAAGDEVWLISAAPTQLVQLIARRMGATGGIGTSIVIRDGIIQPRLAGPMMHGKTKAQMIRKLARERDIDLSASSAYSDSLNDLPLLHVVGHPIAVNPDPRLRLYAIANNWRVCDFRRHRTTSLKKIVKRCVQICCAIVLTSYAINALPQHLKRISQRKTRFRGGNQETT